MPSTTNPFPTDPDRRAIWEMLVPRDIDAFIAADWTMVQGDFIAPGFLGIDAGRSGNPDGWRIGFPTLDAYREAWLRQAQAAAAVAYAEDLRTAIFRATDLADIEVIGDIAVAHKKFDGAIAKADGTQDLLNWQTMYFARRLDGVWRLTGFVGYMPYMR